MTSPRAPGFLDALRALASALDDLNAPAMIIGGVAVIAHGFPRLTADIDATVVAAGLDLDRLVGVLVGHDIRARTSDAVAFAQRTHVFLAIHTPSETPIDLSHGPKGRPPKASAPEAGLKTRPTAPID